MQYFQCPLFKCYINHNFNKNQFPCKSLKRRQAVKTSIIKKIVQEVKKQAKLRRTKRRQKGKNRIYGSLSSMSSFYRHKKYPKKCLFLQKSSSLNPWRKKTSIEKKIRTNLTALMREQKKILILIPIALENFSSVKQLASSFFSFLQSHIRRKGKRDRHSMGL